MIMSGGFSFDSEVNCNGNCIFFFLFKYPSNSNFPISTVMNHSSPSYLFLLSQKTFISFMDLIAFLQASSRSLTVYLADYIFFSRPNINFQAYTFFLIFAWNTILVIIKQFNATTRCLIDISTQHFTFIYQTTSFLSLQCP